MGRFASAKEGSAQAVLVQAMMAHPELVAGTDRSCTELMRACEGGAPIAIGDFQRNAQPLAWQDACIEPFRPGL